MSEQSISARTSVSLTVWIDLFITLVTSEASGHWTLLIVTLIDLRVGITKLDCDIPFQLVLETNCLYT